MCSAMRCLELQSTTKQKVGRLEEFGFENYVLKSLENSTLDSCQADTTNVDKVHFPQLGATCNGKNKIALTSCPA